MTEDTPMSVEWRHPDDLPRDRMIIVKSVSGKIAVARFDRSDPSYPWVIIEDIVLEEFADSDDDLVYATRADGWPTNMIAGWKDLAS